MTRFVYNNTKNISINHMLFKFNCRYYPCVFYKKRPRSLLKIENYGKTIFGALKSYSRLLVKSLLCPKFLKTSP